MLFVTHIAQTLRRWTTSAVPQPVFHPPAALQAALARERARSDRSGTVFSFLTFTRAPGVAGTALARVIDILRQRLRTTDEFGYLDARRIGVVLLDAPAAQAWLIADDVLAEWPSDLARPHCEVFSYPTRESKTVPAAAAATPASRTEPPERRPAVAGGVLSARPIRRMEPLFAHDMPVWKRLVDICGATVGLVLAAPLIALAAVAIRLTSPGPAIYRQVRAGQCGEPFTIFKLRTMRLDADAIKHRLADRNEQDGPAFKIANDPRVTTVGKILRKTSLDELPQLWNVLEGDMSLVGPRPLPLAEAQACEGWQHRRLDVMPGLTGIWQVEGRSRTRFADWVRMDMRYIRARSFVNDLKLLALTIPAVILRKGAH